MPAQYSRITVTRAKSEDIPSFHAFFADSLKTQFPEYKPATIDFLIEKDYAKDWLKKAVEKKNKHVFLAKKGKEIAGYLLTSKNYGGVAMGDWLAVSTGYQKQGIASALLQAWEKQVVDNGGHATFLWTIDANVEFYAKRGYTLSGYCPNSWFGVSMHLFYKQLEEPQEKNFLRNYLKEKKQKNKVQ